jgi:hypothetical protein
MLCVAALSRSMGFSSDGVGVSLWMRSQKMGEHMSKGRTCSLRFALGASDVIDNHGTDLFGTVLLVSPMPSHRGYEREGFH